MLGRVLRKFGVLEGVLVRVLLLIPFQGSPPRSTLASTLASTPSFRSSLPSTLPSYFLDFPVSLFCSRPPRSQHYRDFLTRSTLFWDGGKWGFVTLKPSLPDLGDFDPLQGAHGFLTNVSQLLAKSCWFLDSFRRLVDNFNQVPGRLIFYHYWC